MSTNAVRCIIGSLQLSLVVLLCACATTTSRPNAKAVSAPTSTPKSGTTAQDLALNRRASAEADGVRITSDGVQCQPWIVLKDASQVSDAGAVSEIESYVTKEAGTTDGVHVLIDLTSPLSPPPPSLDVVMGSIGTRFDSVSSYAYQLYRLADSTPRFGCAAAVTVTNTTHETMQLKGLGVTYRSDSTSNSYKYQLLDYCTFEECATCVPLCGGGADCTYIAEIALQNAAQGANITSPLKGLEQCSGEPQAILPPGESIPVLLALSSHSSSQVYRLGLTADIATSEGDKHITFPSDLDSTVAFASPSQFTCFGLNHGQLVPEAPPIKPSCI